MKNFSFTNLSKLLFSLLAVFAFSTQAFATARIEVELVAKEQNPVAGETYTVTHIVRNVDTEDATNLEITNTLPEGFKFVEDAEGFCTSTNPDNTAYSCRPAGNAFTFPDPYVLPGGEQVSFDVLIAVSPDILGEVTDTVGASISNDNFSITSLGEDVVVQSVADLQVNKFASNDVVYAGENFNYDIIVENWGPSVAWDPFVIDTLLAGSDERQWVSANGCSLQVQGCGAVITNFDCTFGARTGRFDLALMGADMIPSVGYVDCEGDAPGSNDYNPVVVGRMLISISLTALEDGVINNYVEVFSQTGASSDPDISNNTTYLTTSFEAASDLEVTKAVTTAPAEPWIIGETEVTYTLTVENLGPSIADNVVLEDVLPEGATVLSANVVGGDGVCSLGSPIICNLGTLDDDESVGPASKSVEITVSVDADFPVDSESCEGVLTNTASATSDSFDLVNTNNIALIQSAVECPEEPVVVEPEAAPEPTPTPDPGPQLTSELQTLLQNLDTALRQLKAPGSQRNKVRRQRKKAVRDARDAVVNFVGVSGDQVILVNSALSVDKRTRRVQKTIRRALRGNASTFGRKKNVARRVVNQFVSAIGG